MSWKQFLITLSAFRKRYGHWPTKIHLFPFFIRELGVRPPQGDFETRNARINIIPDQKSFLLAHDDEGHSLSYSEADTLYPKKAFALEWLGIQEPDYCFKIQMPVTFTRI